MDKRSMGLVYRVRNFSKVITKSEIIIGLCSCSNRIEAATFVEKYKAELVNGGVRLDRAVPVARRDISFFSQFVSPQHRDRIVYLFDVPAPRLT